ncbi:MAG: glutathione peroxidase [bacterium]|nr:glutathione peroxidase [bacterium]
MSEQLFSIPVKKIDGSETSLGEFAGKTLLLVNVASKCGLTPQYEGLEKLYENYRDKGFEVLGFPANNFLAQEPGTEEEIQDFCSTNYNIQFPLFSKISVKGDDQHPLYKELTAERSTADIGNGDAFETKLQGFGQTRENSSDILWNFEKFLIARDGSVAARIAPDVTADDPRLVEMIEAELSA